MSTLKFKSPGLKAPKDRNFYTIKMTSPFYSVSIAGHCFNDGT